MVGIDFLKHALIKQAFDLDEFLPNPVLFVQQVGAFDISFRAVQAKARVQQNCRSAVMLPFFSRHVRRVTSCLIKQHKKSQQSTAKC